MLSDITVIEQRGESVLVDASGRMEYVPADAVSNGQVDQSVLDVGIAHGLPLERIVNVRIDNAALIKALRDMGIYTKDDFMKNFGAIQKRFHRAMDAELKKLIQEVEANG